MLLLILTLRQIILYVCVDDKHIFKWRSSFHALVTRFEGQRRALIQPSLMKLIMIYLQMWENLSTKNGAHILKTPAALNFDRGMAAIIHLISLIRGSDNYIRF